MTLIFEGQTIVHGLDITPQYVLGKYRIDFKVSYDRSPKHFADIAQLQSNVILVECDSQEWHERSEKERRYEKARDRYLISNGHEVFHYTGKEIKDDPVTVAAEIIAHVINIKYCTKEYLISSVRELQVNL
ncbi:MAG: DUF559 domain-containing protein [Nitrospirota bacterium]|nr:DUF559 domain-containing protein [Nitrospirota bacterium]